MTTSRFSSAVLGLNSNLTPGGTTLTNPGVEMPHRSALFTSMSMPFSMNETIAWTESQLSFLNLKLADSILTFPLTGDFHFSPSGCWVLAGSSGAASSSFHSRESALTFTSTSHSGSPSVPGTALAPGTFFFPPPPFSSMLELPTESGPENTSSSGSGTYLVNTSIAGGETFPSKSILSENRSVK